MSSERVRVRAIMTRNVAAVPSGTRIQEALAIMEARELGQLIVLDGQRLFGMVSYPEVAVTEVDWSAPIESVAHKQYAFCFEEDFATDALDTMRSQGATVLPVKNHSGEFSGIVTRTAAESRGTGLPG